MKFYFVAFVFFISTFACFGQDISDDLKSYYTYRNLAELNILDAQYEQVLPS